MITSDERRAIAARIDDLLNSGEDVWLSDEYKCVMGTNLPGATSRISDRRAIIRRIRELCELPDGGEEYSDEELAAHGLLRAPRDADGRLIRLGDMLRTTRGGTEVGEATHIEHQKGVVMVTIDFECDFRRYPDMCASLADEIDRWVDSEQDPDEPYEPLRSIARRLRKMGGDAR